MGKISFALSHENSIVTIVIFAAEGFALASVLLFGKKMWVGIFIGQFLLTYHSLPLVANITIATINSLEAILAVALFDYFKLNRELTTTKDVFGLIVLIIFILQPISALLGNLVLILFSIIEFAEFGKSFFSWWFGNIMGQILLTPTLLLLYSKKEQSNAIELILVALFFIAISYIFQVLTPIQNVSLLLCVTLPLILYLSSKKGIEYATFSIIVITAVTLYLTYLDLGVFSIKSEIDNIINLNFYFLSQMLLLLTIGTLFDEKRRRELELESTIKKEVKKNQEHTLMMLQQSRLAQMGQVLNMIAHQWRQPLNNLLLINEVLVYKYHKEQNISSEDIEKFQKESTLQIKQMSKTIDDFRDFFKPQKKSEDFLVNEVIEQLMLITKPIFIAANISILYTAKEKLYLQGFPNELAQAILNILYNAKDAFIENHIEKREIEIKLEKKEHIITISISDNAGGIPKNIMDEIFNPYFSTKKSTDGTGLGLYMSKMIIQTHMGGFLWAQNNNKGGATFTIELRV